jgi:hypothetical protein
VAALKKKGIYEDLHEIRVDEHPSNSEAIAMSLNHDISRNKIEEDEKEEIESSHEQILG